MTRERIYLILGLLVFVIFAVSAVALVGFIVLSLQRETVMALWAACGCFFCVASGYLIGLRAGHNAVMDAVETAIERRRHA